MKVLSTSTFLAIGDHGTISAFKKGICAYGRSTRFLWVLDPLALIPQSLFIAHRVSPRTWSCKAETCMQLESNAT